MGGSDNVAEGIRQLIIRLHWVIDTKIALEDNNCHLASAGSFLDNTKELARSQTTQGCCMLLRARWTGYDLE